MCIWNSLCLEQSNLLYSSKKTSFLRRTTIIMLWNYLPKKWEDYVINYTLPIIYREKEKERALNQPSISMSENRSAYCCMDIVVYYKFYCRHASDGRTQTYDGRTTSRYDEMSQAPDGNHEYGFLCVNLMAAFSLESCELRFSWFKLKKC